MASGPRALRRRTTHDCRFLAAEGGGWSLHSASISSSALTGFPWRAARAWSTTRSRGLRRPEPSTVSGPRTVMPTNPRSSPRVKASTGLCRRRAGFQRSRQHLPDSGARVVHSYQLDRRPSSVLGDRPGAELLAALPACSTTPRRGGDRWNTRRIGPGFQRCGRTDTRRIPDRVPAGTGPRENCWRRAARPANLTGAHDEHNDHLGPRLATLARSRCPGRDHRRLQLGCPAARQ